MKKAYPVYDREYGPALEEIREFLATLPNLQLIGRNGMHRYNNQDHSMLTAMLAARNILGAKHDLWQVNVDEEYHEQGQEIKLEDVRAIDSTQPHCSSSPRRLRRSRHRCGRLIQVALLEIRSLTRALVVSSVVVAGLSSKNGAEPQGCAVAIDSTSGGCAVAIDSTSVGCAVSIDSTSAGRGPIGHLQPAFRDAKTAGNSSRGSMTPTPRESRR